MIIHCTKKLAAKLEKAGIAVSREPLITEPLMDAIGSWHANITTIQRRQCVLFCHDTTRFALVLLGVTAKELKNLDYWFEDLLANALRKAGIEFEQIEGVLRHLTPLQFDTSCNRSVQGTINQMLQDLEWWVQYEGADIMDYPVYSTSVRLSDRPCSVKRMKKTEYIWPIAEMKQLVSSLPATGTA